MLSDGTHPVAVCFQCGRPLSLLTRLGGERRFCSVEHRKLYQLQQDEFALEALKWNQPTPATVKSDPPLMRKKNPPLCGLIQLDLAVSPAKQPRVLIPGSYAPLTEGFKTDPPRFVPEPSPIGLASTGRLAIKLIAISAAQDSVRGVISPGLFEIGISFPSPGISISERLPAAAGAIPAARNLARPAAFRRLPGRQQTVSPACWLKTIQLIGVNDPDESSSEPQRAMPRDATPAVVGEAIEIRRSELQRGVSTELAAAPDLQVSTRRRSGIFIPRLQMGTLRPRVEYGPVPNVSSARDSGSSAHGRRFQTPKPRAFTAVK
jgi:hypothetical protein